MNIQTIGKKPVHSLFNVYNIGLLVVVFTFTLGACNGGGSPTTPTDKIVAITNTAVPPADTSTPAPPTDTTTPLLPTETATLAFIPPPELLGKVWQWLRFDSNDGTTQNVDNPTKYTLEFLPDGTIQGLADCNTMGGTYTANDSSLTIQATQLTRMACPPESLDDKYVQWLNETATYVIENGVLALNLKIDSGNMVFGEQLVPILPTPSLGGPGATASVNVYVRSGPGSSYPVFGVMPYGRSAEVVGKSQDGQWWAVSIPLAPLGRGWVSGQYVQVVNTDGVQLLDAPPVPPSTEFTGPGTSDPQVTTLDAVYVRSGPGEAYPVYGIAPVGASATAIGRSQDGQWYIVRVNPAMISAGSAWIQSAFVATKNVTQLPVVEAPPLPEQINIPAPPPGAPIGVAMTSVNVRSGPGMNFPVLAVAQTGAVAEVTGKNVDGAWVQIKVPASLSSDERAWVSTSYVYVLNPGSLQVVGSPTPPSPINPAPPSGEVQIATTTEPVNVRSGPGNQYSSYGVAGAGTSGVVVEYSPDGKWVAIRLPTSVAKDGKGWVSTSYVVITKINAATATAMAPTKAPVITATPSSISCKVISVKPSTGKVFKPKAEFDMVVVVQNISNEVWDPNAIDIRFLNATGLVIHQGDDIYDLPAPVGPGEQYTIPIDMQAPGEIGTFGETWGLLMGSDKLCTWSISIVVQ